MSPPRYATVALGAPLNNTVEIGGPELLRFEDFVRQGLRAAGGSARSWSPILELGTSGPELSERTLVPGDGAQLGATRFDDWLSQQAQGS